MNLQVIEPEQIILMNFHINNHHKFSGQASQSKNLKEPNSLNIRLWKWLKWFMCIFSKQDTLHPMQQGHSKGQARWVATHGTNLQGTPRQHWYNWKCGASEIRLPHTQNNLWILPTIWAPPSRRFTSPVLKAKNFKEYQTEEAPNY